MKVPNYKGEETWADHFFDLFEEGGILYWPITFPCQILTGIAGLAILIAFIMVAAHGLYEYIIPPPPNQYYWKYNPAFKAEYTEAKNIVKYVENDPETLKAAYNMKSEDGSASKYIDAYEESKRVVEQWEAE